MSGGARPGAARGAAGALVAVLLAVLVAAGSRVPVTFSRDNTALLRLSWRMPAVAKEECRTLPDAELERLPLHMRNPRACIGVLASYTLMVTVDGALVVVDTVRPPGVRGDRPLNVFRDLPFPPGERQVAVTFRALLPDGVEPAADGVIELNWEGRVPLEGREIALLTLDPTGRRLEVRAAGR